MCPYTYRWTDQPIYKPDPEQWENRCKEQGYYRQKQDIVKIAMVDCNGKHIFEKVIEDLQRSINIRYKRDSNNNPWRVPASKAGKDHANDYGERRGIDEMFDEHVLTRYENNTIKR